MVFVYTISNTCPGRVPALTAPTHSGPALLSAPKPLELDNILLLCFIAPTQGGQKPYTLNRVRRPFFYPLKSKGDQHYVQRPTTSSCRIVWQLIFTHGC